MAASTTIDGITIGADGKAQQGAGGAGEPAVLPDPNKPAPAPASARLTIGLPSNAYVLDYDMNALTQWVEEETGYDIEFILYSGSNISTQIATTIAAGQRLPDILFGVDLNANTVSTYGQDGYFVDLSNYYKDTNGASYIFWNRISSALSDSQIEQIVSAIVDPTSGGIYAVPTVQASPSTQALYQPYINQVWLDKLGLSMPTNLEEFYSVLKAFREQDPNGNGLPDEIPLMGSSKVQGGDVVSWLINMYMYYDPSNPYQTHNYSDITADYTEDAYRQALMFVNRLYKEGLLSAISFTASAADMRNLVTPADGTAICGVFCGNPELVANASSPVIEEYAAMPLWGYAVEKPISIKNNTFITKDCAEPSAAFKVLMALWSYEGSTRVRYGEYDSNWSEADPGAMSNYGLPANIKLHSDPIFRQNSAQWGVVASCFLPYANGEDIQAVASEGPLQHIAKLQTDAITNFAAAKNNNPYYIQQTSLLKLEDPDFANTTNTNLKRIRDQYQTGFIMGTYDPANDAAWRQYQTELSNADLELFLTKLTKAYQDSWDCSSVCNHFISFASCTEDGGCIFCSFTNSLAHDHAFDGYLCIYCGRMPPELFDGKWEHLGVVKFADGEGSELDRTYLHFSDDGTGSIGSSFYHLLPGGLESEEYWGGSYIVYEGEYYTEAGFGTFGDFTYTVNGDTIVMQINHYGEYCGTMTLQKSGVDRYQVVAIEGLVLDETVTATIPIGSEFIFH
jgi:putative aldouronate transport system substrate-binding protein